MDQSKIFRDPNFGQIKSFLFANTNTVGCSTIIICIQHVQIHQTSRRIKGEAIKNLLQWSKYTGRRQSESTGRFFISYGRKVRKTSPAQSRFFQIAIVSTSTSTLIGSLKEGLIKLNRKEITPYNKRVCLLYEVISFRFNFIRPSFRLGFRLKQEFY